MGLSVATVPRRTTLSAVILADQPPVVHRPVNFNQPGDLIKIDESGLRSFGREFVKNEALGGLTGALVTAVAKFLLDYIYSGACPPEIQAPVLALAQPLAEKPVLTARSIIQEYRNSPPQVGGRTLSEHLATIKRGIDWDTLIADIGWHDSSQAAYMGGATYFYPPTTPFEASLYQAAAFSLALVTAIGLQVKTVDLKYKLFARKLHNLGFKSLSYFESRYLIDPRSGQYNPEVVLNQIASEFSLPFQLPLYYHDCYVQSIALNRFNEWAPHFRFRERTSDNGDGIRRSTQVNFTRAFEVRRKENVPYRCFGVAKRKFYRDCEENKMYLNAGQIPDPRLRRAIKKIEGKGDYCDLRFWRFRAQNPNGLLVTVDIPSRSETVPDLKNITIPYWIEVKVWDLPLLLGANDYILREFPVYPTTKTKFELFNTLAT